MSQVEVGLQLVQVAFVDAQLFAVHPVRQLGARAAQPQPHAERRIRRQRAPPLVRGLQAAQQVGKIYLDFFIKQYLILSFAPPKRDGSSPESSSELDSGISVNVNYEDPTRWNKRGESNRGSASPDEEKGRKSGNKQNTIRAFSLQLAGVDHRRYFTQFTTTLSMKYIKQTSDNRTVSQSATM